MSDHTITLKNYYPRTVPLDDGVESDESRVLPIRIRRFSKTQMLEFHADFVKVMNPESLKRLARKPDGDEQERDHKNKLRVPDADIRARRLAEMPASDRAVFDALEKQEETFTVDFCMKVISEHVWLPPGVSLVLEEDDETKSEPARRGSQLAAMFAGNLSMLLRIVKAVHEENTLSPESKKVLRSLSGSTASSSTPGGAAAGDGEKPAAAVSNAGTEASAASGAASVDQDPIRSGSTVVA